MAVTLQLIYAAAEAVHAAARAADPSLPPWAQLGDVAPAYLNDLLFVTQEIAEGRVTRADEIHAARVAKQRAAGWPYGLTEEAATKLHPFMVPLANLPVAWRTRDALVFRTAKANLAGA